MLSKKTISNGLILISLCCSAVYGLSDKRLCGDSKCNTLISMGVGVHNYRPGDKGMVPFQINSNIRILSKSAGKDKSVWGIEVGGRRGYAPQNSIKETKIFIQSHKLIEVPVEDPSDEMNFKDPTTTEPTSVESSIIENSTTIPLTNELGLESKRYDTSEDSKSRLSPELIGEVSESSNINVTETLKNELHNNGSVSENPTSSIVINESSEKLNADENIFVQAVSKNPGYMLEESVSTERLQNPSSEERMPDILESKTNIPKIEKPNSTKTFQIDGTLKIAVESTKGEISIEHKKETDQELVTEHTVMSNSNEFTRNNVNTLNTTNQNNPNENWESDFGVSQIPNLTAEHENLDSEKNQVKEEFELRNEFSQQFVSNNTEEIAPHKEKETIEMKENKTTPNVDNSILPFSNESGENTDADQTLEISGQNMDADQTLAYNQTPISNAQSLKDSNSLLPEITTIETDGGIALETGENITENDLTFDTSLTENNLTIDTTPLPTDPVYPANMQHSVQKIDDAAERLGIPKYINENENYSINQLEQYPTDASNWSHDIQIDHKTPPEYLQEKDIKTYVEKNLNIPHQQITQKTISKRSEEEVTMEGAEEIISQPAKVNSPMEQKEVVEYNELQQNKLSESKQHSDGINHRVTDSYEEQASHHLHATKVENIQGSNNTQHIDNLERHDSATTQQLPSTTVPETSTLGSTKDSTEDIKMNAEKVIDPIHILQNPNAEFKEFTAESEKKNIAESLDRTTLAHELHNEANPEPLPLTTQHNYETVKQQQQGLFATILAIFNAFLKNDKLDEIPVTDIPKTDGISYDSEFCEKLTPNSCPSRSHLAVMKRQCEMSNMPFENFLEKLAANILDMSDILACLAITATTSLFLICGYYCFSNCSRESSLLAKLNLLERSLLATYKENAILKHDLLETRGKLSSIEDNSFGANEMVIALRNDLEAVKLEKQSLNEQIGNLEKELENAAEAGLELNKIVSELLSNQTGDEFIIGKVEELQKQLNEQQNTILEINANLAEKSRENSELQLMIAEQNARLSGEIASLQQDNEELEAEKTVLQTRMNEIKSEFEVDITKALEGKNLEIKRLQIEISKLKAQSEDQYTRWQTSLAKIEALEDCLKLVKRDPKVNMNDVIDVVNVRAELLDLQKQKADLKERLEAEKDARTLLEDQVKIFAAEVEKTKQEFNQSEKDKLEAQTRLEVLSNYFKEKEAQLQKELSVKEAMWLKQQGEKTSTVDRLTTMQEEIQSLRSQNDALRVEIEAQLAAHKAQTGTLEHRAHESWLAARQSERRCEEARTEATALRRKLTVIAGGVNSTESNRPPAADAKFSTELNGAPSPIQMESPGSPLLGRMPPPFLPPQFMGQVLPPPPFMPLPPPFMRPLEMRPPPLGRLMSPPPLPPDVGPHPHLERYNSSEHDGDSDDYDDEVEVRPRGRRRSSAGSWRRDSYSPPRPYRSHSPADSRYDYAPERDLISTYDTETDFSPPPSLRDRHTREPLTKSGFRAYSPQPSASSPLIADCRRGKRLSSYRGVLSSGSEKSYDSLRQSSKGKAMV